MSFSQRSVPGCFAFAAILVALVECQTAVIPSEILSKAYQAAALVDTTPYDEMSALSVHNAYERPVGLGQQLERASLRSLELDIQPDKRGSPDLPDDWYVYHRDLPLFDDSRCTRLSDCLETLSAFQAAQPRHEPVTIFVDLKQPFEGSHTPKALDAQLVKHLGAKALFTPADLVARCPGAKTPAEAVAQCGWPTLNELRGRFLVAITGGGSCEKDLPLAGYASDSATALARVAFLAPSIEGSCGLEDYRARVPWAVFFNLDWAHRDEVSPLRKLKMVTRLYQGGIAGALDDEHLVAAQGRERPTFLVTDRIDWP